MSELKPCKCGETEPNVHVQMTYCVGGGDDAETWGVTCENCYDQDMFGYATPEEAIEAWNRRAGESI